MGNASKLVRSLRSRVVLALVIGTWLALGRCHAGDPELRPRPVPTTKVSSPPRKAPPKRSKAPRPRPTEEPTSSRFEEDLEQLSGPPISRVTPSPIPLPSASSVPLTPPTESPASMFLRRRQALVTRPTPRPPGPSDLLGRWNWAVGGGRRTGTVHLTTIRNDGRAVGTFVSTGMAGRCEAFIGGGRVEFIMRWSVFFVQGRVHGTAPAEHLQRNPIRLEGQWEGTNLEGLTSDFLVTREGP